MHFLIESFRNRTLLSVAAPELQMKECLDTIRAEMDTSESGTELKMNEFLKSKMFVKRLIFRVNLKQIR